ncbi:MAG: DUF456 domain-containing protein [Bacteroidales bacterium]|nr:DUF456 domain-containing protein [Bacteroidales bacterium]
MLIALSVVLVVAGVVGSIVPALPGPPLSWLALLLIHLSPAAQFSPAFLGATAAAAAAITVLDYVVPSLSTKRHGGSKAGVTGCNIGLIISIIGLPFGPSGLLGVIFWPFVGALVGELISGQEKKAALHAAWGAFLGFLTGTGLKLAYALFAGVWVVRELFV